MAPLLVATTAPRSWRRSGPQGSGGSVRAATASVLAALRALPRPTADCVRGAFQAQHGYPQ
eukprot:7290913-Pyramimonas_sp.AAC.1